MRRSGRSTLRFGWVAPLVALALVVAACGKSSPSASGSVTLRLGYFPNLTHAPAIIGLQKGFFKNEVGSKVTIEAKTFNAGPDVVTAIFSDALDIAYIGPNPSINAWSKSKGTAIKIIAGSTSGGAELVVKASIKTPKDLKGKTIASPQLGNTQDVALRSWLRSQGFKTTAEGGGDVKVKPEPNSDTIDAFKAGAIDGAWVPEPYASRLVVENGAHVLVNEATLWPGGKFVTTQVIVRQAFLKAHPDVVKAFLKGHIEAVDYANANSAAAQALVNAQLQALTGKSLKPETIAAAWKNLTFTVDPIATTLKQSAQNAIGLKLLDPVDLNGIYDLAPLNALLKVAGKPEVSAG